MDANGRPQAGEIVYLASELVVEGGIHEIGTRALVLEEHATALALEVGGHAVTCPREAVAPRRRRSSRAACWRGGASRRVGLARE